MVGLCSLSAIDFGYLRVATPRQQYAGQLFVDNFEGGLEVSNVSIGSRISSILVLALCVAAADAGLHSGGASVSPINGESIRGGAALKFRCDNKCNQMVAACVVTAGVDCSKPQWWNTACGSSVTKVNTYYQCIEDVAGTKDDTCKNDTPSFCTQSKSCTCTFNAKAGAQVCTAVGVAQNSNPVTRSKQCP